MPDQILGDGKSCGIEVKFSVVLDVLFTFCHRMKSIMKDDQGSAPRRGRWFINWKRELLETLAILGVALLVAGVWFGTHPQDWLRLCQSGAIPFLPTPTPRPLLVVVVSTPTPDSGDSRLFTLHYNESSFYLLNASGSSLDDVSSLAFERLDASGRPQNSFSGQAWAGEQASLAHDTCNGIEIEGRGPFSRPAGCAAVSSLLTVPESAELIFWTTATGSETFRVLWQEEPVGECQVATGECSFYLP